jgi:hypothetical protein
MGRTSELWQALKKHLTGRKSKNVNRFRFLALNPSQSLEKGFAGVYASFPKIEN